MLDMGEEERSHTLRMLARMLTRCSSTSRLDPCLATRYACRNSGKVLRGWSQHLMCQCWVWRWAIEGWYLLRSVV